MTDIVCIFKQYKIVQSMFPDVHKLITLYLVLPITSAIRKKPFSAIRQLKRYMCYTKTQDALNSLLLLHCHENILDKIFKNQTEIVKDFISSNSKEGITFYTSKVVIYTSDLS